MEISGVPESVTDHDLERKFPKLLEKNDVEVHSDHIEVCHWIKSNAGPQRCRLKSKSKENTEKFRFVFDWHQFSRVH